MKGASLHQRLTCGPAPRRCCPASVRPGTRVCVIVPSKDNASGSSGKRTPLLWTFSDVGSSRGVLQSKQVLEEVFSREVEEPPHYAADATRNTVASSDHAQEHEGLVQQQQHVGSKQHLLFEVNGIEARSRRSDYDAREMEGQHQEQMEAEVRRERIASAALASTSEIGRSQQGPHHQALTRHHHQQQLFTGHRPHHRRQEHVRSALNGGAHLNGASHVAQFVEERQHQLHQPQQQQSNHQFEISDSCLNPLPVSSEQVSYSQQLHPTVNDTEQQGDQEQEPLLHGSSQSTERQIEATTASAANGVAASASTADAVGGANVALDSSIPGSIWMLCCISAALTCASCVFNTALPIYMVSELKMSMRSMGMFEGLLEAFSYVVRMCSGVVSDRMTSRKAAIALGFAAGAAAKFGMAGAGSVGVLFASKAVDRLANGIQAAPRDALIGDLSPPGVRSTCFGLAQSLRKWGSAVGALAAFFLMKASNNNYQLIFYSASMVSLVACLAFVVFVPAHKRPPTPAQQQQAAATPVAAAPHAVSSSSASRGGLPLGAREFVRSVASMGSDFYRMLGVISLYALGHINESLLEARAMEVGFGKAEATLVVAAIAAVTFLTAYPLGRLDDRFGAGTTFAVGVSALIAGDLVLLLSGPHPLALFASCLFLGVHWAVIQGPLLSIVSGLAPPNLRGTAFGIFYTVMAITAVGANTMYGSIWHTYGANAAFATSAALMSVVLAALPYMLPASARRCASATAAAVCSTSAPQPLAALTCTGSPLPAAA